MFYSGKWLVIGVKHNGALRMSSSIILPVEAVALNRCRWVDRVLIAWNLAETGRNGAIFHTNGNLQSRYLRMSTLFSARIKNHIDFNTLYHRITWKRHLPFLVYIVTLKSISSALREKFKQRSVLLHIIFYPTVDFRCRVYEDEVQSSGILFAQEEQKEALHSAFSHQTAAYVRTTVQGATTKVQCAVDADPQRRRSTGESITSSSSLCALYAIVHFEFTVC